MANQSITYPYHRLLTKLIHQATLHSTTSIKLTTHILLSSYHTKTLPTGPVVFQTVLHQHLYTITLQASLVALPLLLAHGNLPYLYFLSHQDSCWTWGLFGLEY